MRLRTRWSAWWLALGLALLAGCASPPRAPGPADPVAGPWSGRLALQVQDQASQSFSASFELKGSARAGELTLFSPLGGVLGLLAWEPGSAMLRANGQSRQFDSVDAAVAHVTGSAIPVAALFDWLRGINTAVAGWRPSVCSPLPKPTCEWCWSIRACSHYFCKMKALYDVPAPAKLNLFLHVTGRRPDGMHLLQSAFMLIDWCDTLHFELRPGAALSREDLGAALPADDLVLRAARALQAASATHHGAHIAIEKRLPAEAGMGGGSSDAASCLLALNRLWGLNYPLAQLARIGVALGADVPFFLGGRNAWVEGIGEQLTPIDLPPARFAVVKPAEGLETPRIFADPELKRDSEPAIISGFAANPYGFGSNVLQPVAQRLCPGVTQALQWLGSQGLAGRMTGSGSAVFAKMPRGMAKMPQGNAQTCSLQAAPAGWQVRECGNLEAHPLVGWAPSDDSSVGG